MAATTPSTPSPAGDRGEHAPASPWMFMLLIAGAWLAIGIWAGSVGAYHLGHGGIARTGAGSLVGLGLFAAGWTAMTAAMMLPTATTFVATFRRVIRHRPDRLLVEGAMVGGFLAVWLVIGVVFWVGDSAVHAVVDRLEPLESHPRLIAGAVLVGAGLFQFTSLKYRCLTACRSPSSFVYRHWRGGNPLADGFRVGVAYGRSCIGCCWALMLVLFALGIASLTWMLVFSAIMALEKAGVLGRSVVAAVGVGLLALGLTVFAGLWPTSSVLVVSLSSRTGPTVLAW